MTILVTGSTGLLGAPTLAALRASGCDAHGLTRSGRSGSAVGDLLTGEGVSEALAGVDTVVHCAQTAGRRDLQLATNLTAAAAKAGVRHLVLISIVGIESIPLGYYRQRVEIEKIAQMSGLPLTILRATQFHSFLDKLLVAQRYLPVILAPRWRFQPIAAEEVAARLAELATGEPQGRVPDIGGPHQLEMSELIESWKAATGSRRPSITAHLPGALFAAYDNGSNLVPGAPFGRQTFAEYLAHKYQS